MWVRDLETTPNERSLTQSKTNEIGLLKYMVRTRYDYL